MVLFNHAAHQMAAKIVYYGPGLCGKTTNLSTVYRKTSQQARGEMVSLNTDTDRTLFFDLLPMDMGVVWGFKARLQLYTVPGQVFYDATRKLVLKGADGIVFVADSQARMLDANRESLRNLELNLRALGMDLQDMPLVFQWNKRDLGDLVPIEQLEAELNPRHLPSFCSVASEGTGVFETLKGIARQTLVRLKARHFTAAGVPVEAVPAPEPPPARPVQPKPVLRGRLSIPAPFRPMVNVPVPRIPRAPRPVPPKVSVPKIVGMPPVKPGPLPRGTPSVPVTQDPEATAV